MFPYLLTNFYDNVTRNQTFFFSLLPKKRSTKTHIIGSADEEGMIPPCVDALYNERRTVLVHLHARSPPPALVVVVGNEGATHPARQLLFVAGTVSKLPALAQAERVQAA